MNELAKVDYEKPLIPDLNDAAEVDLEKLGSSPLTAVIKFTGMQPGNLVRPRWVGASPEGVVFDDIGAEVPIVPADLADGKRIEITNTAVRSAAGGWAFFSYTVNGQIESLRRFCFIGVRPRTPSEALSVIHALPSHDLVLRPSDFPDVGVTLVVAPYQAMQIGDTITVKLVGYDEDGVEDDERIDVIVVSKAHMQGQSLSVDVPRYWFSYLEGGYVCAGYRIKFADGLELDAPEQRFEVDSSAALPPYLPKPTIVGHAEGTPLDPAKFRDGLTIQVPTYPDMTVSDRILVRWRSAASDTILPLRVDPSTLVAGPVRLMLPAEVLTLSSGTSARLSYLYGRENASLSAEALPVDVVIPRTLRVPDVGGAQPDSTPAWGTLTALNAVDGVYINVPADTLAPGETLEVHWAGKPPHGHYIARTPVRPENPLRFFIPAQYVAANLGRGDRDESKRFDVFYRLTARGDHVDSPSYRLRIKPFASSAYPQITCLQASGSALSLARVPATGADLTLGTWYLAAPGQLLTVSLSGVSAEGPLEAVIYDRVAVTAEQASTGVKATLSKQVLEQLSIGTSFTLRASVSYDGGDYFTPMRSSTLTLSR